jgi:hypothetical protein
VARLGRDVAKGRHEEEKPMRKPIAVAAASCCLALAAAGEAGAATLSVDAKNSCLDLTTGKLFGAAPAFLALPNGKYTASMTSTATLGASGGALDKVYFYLQTPNRPFNSLNIISTRNPNNFAVNGNGTHFQNGITAFVVDADCSDNVGTITMTVTRRP